MTREDLASVADRLAPALLVACATASLTLLMVQPFDHGHRWQVAPIVTAYITGIWFVYRRRPQWFVGNHWLLGSVLVVGLVVAFVQLSSLHPEGEVIEVYEGVFGALDRGVNPYDCECIPHATETGAWEQGNFNYPPTEIWPYFVAHLALGAWNRFVITLVFVALGVAACVVLRLTFPEVPAGVLVCYFPILVFFGLQTNSATALFMVSLVVLLIRRNLGPPWLGETLLAVVFSIGLLTKFVLIPVFAAFYWGRVRLDKPVTLLRPALGASAVLGLAALQMAPFGVGNVLRETVLFNLALDTRAELATFYPNVVSGVFTWLSLEDMYPVVAVLALGAAVLMAPLLRTFSAILLAVITFMFVATTPEPQFVPIVLYLALAGALAQVPAAGTATLRPGPVPSRR